jgi:anthranilate phosphoribosyltransferase
MSISHYIKEIGRGKDGARPLSREQAADLLGQVLDGIVTDLEIGGFCLAMRIKGETPEEMAGFLDAVHKRLNMLPASDGPVVVLPSYNGARKLPVLTPLLALLLAREGVAVLVHGTPTESSRVFSSEVLSALGVPALKAIKTIAPGEVAFAPTELLSPALKRLLDVRRAVGLRNPAHSLVKLMNPVAGKALLVSSYTHPEYALSMAGHAFALGAAQQQRIGLDQRRSPQMQGFIQGERVLNEEGLKGTLPSVPDLPKAIDADSTAAYIRSVLAGDSPLPPSIAQQVANILQLIKQL